MPSISKLTNDWIEASVIRFIRKDWKGQKCQRACIRDDDSFSRNLDEIRACTWTYPSIAMGSKEDFKCHSIEINLNSWLEFVEKSFSFMQNWFLLKFNISSKNSISFPSFLLKLPHQNHNLSFINRIFRESMSHGIIVARYLSDRYLRLDAARARHHQPSFSAKAVSIRRRHKGQASWQTAQQSVVAHLSGYFRHNWETFEGYR